MGPISWIHRGVVPRFRGERQGRPVVKARCFGAFGLPGKTRLTAHPMLLPRRARPGIRRDRRKTTLPDPPADRDLLLGRHRIERVGSHAVDADRIEVVAERQLGGDAVDEPVRPSLVGAPSVSLSVSRSAITFQPSSVTGSHLCAASAPRASPDIADTARIATAMILASGMTVSRIGEGRACCLDPASSKVKITRLCNDREA